MTVPRELGGLGADLRTLTQVAMALGAACPSTAWVTSLSRSRRSRSAPVCVVRSGRLTSPTHTRWCVPPRSSRGMDSRARTACGCRGAGGWRPGARTRHGPSSSCPSCVRTL
ncbi:hypothetical protein [Streptomyces sp. NPDC001348]